MTPENNERFSLDLLCMGRAAVDLYGDQLGAELQDTSTFSKYVGGCAANVAIGASRLGLDVGMLTRLGDEAMGHFVRRTLLKEGVDVSRVVMDPERLTGLVLLGVDPPDHFPLVFYRENCADMALSRDDMDAHTFSRVGALLVTGTQLSTVESFEVVLHAIRLASRAGAKIVLDIDFRPTLWGLAPKGDGESRFALHDLVAERLDLIISQCDLVVGTEEELQVAANCEHVSDAVSQLRSRCPGILVQKRGERGCVVYGNEGTVEGRAFKVEIFNVLGAGDAFLAGFLRGWLRGASLEECCTFANASGGLVVRRHGCAPAIPYWDELEAFIQEAPCRKVEHLHRTGGRRFCDLCVVAFDHRDLFQTFPDERVRQLKHLIFEGVKSARGPCETVCRGVLVDEHYGRDVLNDVKGEKLWVGKPIEFPGALPLEFLEHREACDILRTWPQNHVVKVLVRLPKEDTGALFNRQLKTLQKLQRACKVWGHELLIELITDNSDYTCIHDAMDNLYQNNVFPEWWKLQPFLEKGFWAEVNRIVDAYDSHCYGVLILGQDATLPHLCEVMAMANDFTSVRGFALGRCIWGDVTFQWLEGRLEDEELKAIVRSRYERMLLAWCNRSQIHPESVETPLMSPNC